MNQTPAKSTDWLDGAAIGLSGLCLLHCLALPFFAGALPMLMPFTESHLHAQVLYFAIPLSAVAIGIGYARHRDARVVFAAVAGLALLVVGATVAHASLGVVADRLFTISGSITLAAAHLWNGLLSRRHSCLTAHD
jgi:hypothetical protein